MNEQQQKQYIEFDRGFKDATDGKDRNDGSDLVLQFFSLGALGQARPESESYNQGYDKAIEAKEERELRNK